MFKTIEALILRETRWKESDRILTALTAKEGKLTLAAHGALSRKSRMAAATQMLTWSEFTVFEKEGRHTVREAVVKEGFEGLRTDLKRFSLATFFADCLEQFAAEGEPEAQLLQLGLNSLWALSRGAENPGKVEAAFLFRLMSLEGYAPLVDSVENPVLDFYAGAVTSGGRGIPLPGGSLPALQHILNAPPRKLLQFSLCPEDEAVLTEAAETWFLRCADRHFDTLDYYHKI